MSAVETARLVGEIVGIFVVLLAGLGWLTKLLWRVREEVSSVGDSTAKLSEEFVTLNGTLNRHLDEDLVVQKELGENVAHLKGQMAERGTIQAEAALAAETLITNAAIAAAKLIADAKEVPPST